jgi:hypothetical protein
MLSKDAEVKEEPMEIDESALSAGPITKPVASSSGGDKRKAMDSPDGPKSKRAKDIKHPDSKQRKRAPSTASSSSRKSLSPNPAVDGKV